MDRRVTFQQIKTISDPQGRDAYVALIGRWRYSLVTDQLGARSLAAEVKGAEKAKPVFETTLLEIENTTEANEETAQ